AESFTVRARECARSDRLARRNECFDDGGQNFALAITDVGVDWHTKMLSVVSNRAAWAGRRNCLELAFTNHFRCKNLGFGPKMRYRLDSRNGVGWCQACGRFRAPGIRVVVSKPHKSGVKVSACAGLSDRWMGPKYQDP